MIRIFDRSHTEARRLLASGAPVFLPVNPVEYHGPHLSLHNDGLIARRLADLLHARLAAANPEWPLLLADDLEIGVDPCPGPGSRYTPYPVACELVREACGALADLGAQRVVLMTFHGSPLHSLALEQGVRLLARRGVPSLSPFNLVLDELVDLDPAAFADVYATLPVAARAAVQRDIASDFHAGFFETSVALHLAPESVSPDHLRLPPCPPLRPAASARAAAMVARRIGAPRLAAQLDFAARGIGWRALRPFPGYTGRPHLASAAAGAAFVRHLIDRYATVVPAVLAGRAAPPAPIMSWLSWLSLGGRVGGLAVPGADELLPPPPSAA